MLIQLISQATCRNVRAIVIRQQDTGSLITIARKTHVGLVVEETESEQSFIDWLNEVEDATAMPLIGWSQRYDAKSEALVFRPVTASRRADSAKRAAA